MELESASFIRKDPWSQPWPFSRPNFDFCISLVAPISIRRKFARSYHTQPSSACHFHSFSSFSLLYDLVGIACHRCACIESTLRVGKNFKLNYLESTFSPVSVELSDLLETALRFCFQSHCQKTSASPASLACVTLAYPLWTLDDDHPAFVYLRQSVTVLSATAHLDDLLMTLSRRPVVTMHTYIGYLFSIPAA